MERRPTCHVYNEIIMCRAIFLNLKDCRSHGKKAEAERGQRQGARPPALGARPGLDSNQDSVSGLNSTDLKDQSKPYNQCRFDLTVQIHLKRLYNQGLWSVMPGQCVGDSVLSVWLVLHQEVVAYELADPVVLRDRGEALVEEELQAVVVRPNRETSPPQVWPPVTNGVHQPDEFALVCSERTMARSDGAAEEGDGVLVLEQHRAETVRLGVALDDKLLLKVGEGQHRCRGDGALERLESRGCVVGPHEAMLLKQRGQRGGNGAVVQDKLAVVPHQAQESPHSTRRTGLRPVRHRLHLGGVHGHALLGDDVAEVGDGRHPEGALGAFDEQLVLLQHGEDSMEVSKVVGQRSTIDQNIVKKHKHKPTKERAQDVVHEGFECRRC